MGNHTDGLARRALSSCILAASIALSAWAEPILSDQFDEKADAGTLLASEKVVLLWSAEREAPARIASMEQALKDAGIGTVSVVRVSDLSALPFFVPKSAVVSTLRKNAPDLRLLLDWKGEIAAKEGFKGGSRARVYAGGRLIAEARIDQATGKPETGSFAALAAAIGK